MRSTTSPMSFGARMRLANTDIPLREACPKRAQRLSQGRLAIGGPERDQIPRLAISHAAKFHGGTWLGRDSFRLSEGRADVLRCHGLFVRRQDEPCGRSPRREPG